MYICMRMYIIYMYTSICTYIYTYIFLQTYVFSYLSIHLPKHARTFEEGSVRECRESPNQKVQHSTGLEYDGKAMESLQELA